MNFIKKMLNNFQEKKEIKKMLNIKLEDIRKQFEREPGIIRQIFEDDTGVYVKVRIAYTGKEIWRWKNGDIYAQTVERFAPASDFKGMKDFVTWIKELEEVE
jgi:predicted amino acid racemase